MCLKLISAMITKRVINNIRRLVHFIVNDSLLRKTIVQTKWLS